MMAPLWFKWRPSRSLRQRCLDVMGKLELSANVDVYDLCLQVSEARGRTLRLVPFDLPVSAPEGFLVATDQEDFIVFERSAVPLYQQQIILHEVGHILFGHDTDTVLAEDAIRLLMPSLDPALVQRVLGREHTSSNAEKEAELVGTLLGERISEWSTKRTWPVLPEDEELIERLVRAIGQSGKER